MGEVRVWLQRTDLPPHEVLVRPRSIHTPLPQIHRLQHASAVQNHNHGLRRDLLRHWFGLDPNPGKLLLGRLVQRPPRPLLRRLLQNLLRHRYRLQRPRQRRTRDSPLPPRRSRHPQGPCDKLQMDFPAHNLPWWYFITRQPSPTLPHVLHRYELGRHGQGSHRNPFLRGTRQGAQEFQIHVPLVPSLRGRDDLPLRGRTSAVAHQFFHGYMAAVDDCRQPLFVTDCAQPGADVVYLLSSSFVSGATFVRRLKHL